NIIGRIHASQAFEDRANLFNELGLVNSRDFVYKALFSIYRQIIEYNTHESNKNINKDEIFIKYNDLRLKLRNGNYRIAHKIGYELYYIMPNIMRLVDKMRKQIIS